MKIVVVGGVAGGASVAARARRLDESAEIIVLERGGYVSFANCGLPYHIGGVITDRSRLLLQTPESLRESLDIDVRIGSEVVALDVDAQDGHGARGRRPAASTTETYDALALCQGADPLQLPLPGADLPGIHVLRNIHDMDAIKAQPRRGAHRGEGGRSRRAHRRDRRRVHRRRDGGEPAPSRCARSPSSSSPTRSCRRSTRTCRSRSSSTSAGAASICTWARPRRRSRRGADGGIRVELDQRTSCWMPTSSCCRRECGRTCRSHGTAGLEIGARGGIVVDTHMRTSDPRIWAAGDAVETPHTVLPGSWSHPARRAREPRGARRRREHLRPRHRVPLHAGHLDREGLRHGRGRARARPSVSSARRASRTARCTCTRPVTPATTRAPRRCTSRCCSLPRRAPSSARRSPASTGSTSGSTCSPPPSALGATVHDLESLELAYAPPFGSAKDPVNMAGFVATNVLQGRPGALVRAGLPRRGRGRAHRRRAHPRGVRASGTSPARRTCRSATCAPHATTWDRVRRAAPLLRRRLPQLPRVPHPRAAGLRRRGDAVGRIDDVPVLARPRAGRLHAPSRPRSTTPRRSTRQGRLARHRRSRRPRLHRTRVPGADHEARRRRWRPCRRGDDVVVHVSDPGFAHDGPAWAASHGHQLLDDRARGSGLRRDVPQGRRRRLRHPRRSRRSTRCRSSSSRATWTRCSPRSSSRTARSRWGRRCRCSSPSGASTRCAGRIRPSATTRRSTACSA